MSGPDTAATAARWLRAELPDCDECRAREMAEELARQLVPLIEASERQRIRDGAMPERDGYYVPADLLDGAS